MIKTTLKYSVICGVFLYVLFLLSQQFGTNPFIDLNQLFFDFIIFLLFSYFSMNEYKKYKNGGYLHFWQGMTIGFLLYVPAIFLFAVILFVHFAIEPGLLEQYREAAMEYLESNKATYLDQFGEKQYESQVEAIENVNQTSLIRTSSLKKILVGLFVTPMISIFLRKKPK